ncbi:Phosphonate ABC transporter phosphate-binding periplasmic component (TC 3.A.1.9.1) [hydrothermal vent metagenome]|uniref:Phosphonate ABC transporter phosphate-binding periplasmic component (TC 3.A.1.9.1) n=1 Tax=hydrothermal vent metagenome TaxID=652676 RepID=A0A3B0ZM30_9ZZZZ
MKFIGYPRIIKLLCVNKKRSNNMEQYLEHSKYIDYENAKISALAKSLASNLNSKKEIAKVCFEWVRDNIKHSNDYKLNPVTCKASDVLNHKTGYCFAKSHLLAALLRVNEIPAGLCYQRLSINDNGAPYSLHGLNSVYLEEFGWYRIDARGNKEGVNAQFSPPNEKLAFTIQFDSEIDFTEILSKPLPVVVSVLEKYESYIEVLQNLPDIKTRAL